jgi:hypothetical protein
VTESSTQNVQADHLIEEFDLTSMLGFAFGHFPVVICRSCVFRMASVVQIIIIHSADDDCGDLKIVCCPIVESSTSNIVTHVHEFVTERSAVERVGGMLADLKLISEAPRTPPTWRSLPVAFVGIVAVSKLFIF